LGGKILERALIFKEFLNKNQYGFIPQTKTTDANMVLKHFVQEGFSKGEITAIVSLYVEGAFNSAWAPSVLKNLQGSGCSRNLYNITKNYFSKRRETMTTNNIKL